MVKELEVMFNFVPSSIRPAMNPWYKTPIKHDTEDMAIAETPNPWGIWESSAFWEALRPI
jgi:hypothetical protein